MKLINHVLDIRRLIQQAFDNRFSRMGLRKEAATPVEQIPAEHQEKRKKLDELMKLSGRQLLVDKGSISHEQAKQKAIAEFEKYRKLEMLQYESDYDRAIRELIDKEKEKNNES